MVLFVIGELVLIGLPRVRVHPGWWLHGERHTGVVIAVEENGDGPQEVTIRDPDTELDQVVTPAFWSPVVGDRGTAVVHSSDPSKVGTSGSVAAYFVVWSLLPLAALGWAICCGRWLIKLWMEDRHRRRSVIAV